MQTGGIVSPDNLAKIFLNIQVGFVHKSIRRITILKVIHLRFKMSKIYGPSFGSSITITVRMRV